VRACIEGNRVSFAGYPRAVFFVVASVLCSGAALAGAKPDIKTLQTGPIAVDATVIRAFQRFEEPNQHLSSSKLTFRGGLVLTSPSPNFGGWSGLVLDDDAKSFLAISDTGVWMSGTLAYDGVHPIGIEHARLGPLPSRDGTYISRDRNRDSEAIALESGNLQQGSVLVAFESRHRIERYDLSPSGFSADRGIVPLPAAARRMRANQGLEGMTVMKGGPYKGSLVAFSERLYDSSRNHTGWLWTKKGPVTVHLKNIGDYDITDLSSLDDGTLFVLERRFRWTEGVKMRLRRLSPDELKPGRTAEGETLIEADLSDQIDNMEGLAVTRLKSGEVLVTMISDDNFNHMLQRTILLQFAVNGSTQAKARP
jgi:hypothetical protein